MALSPRTRLELSVLYRLFFVYPKGTDDRTDVRDLSFPEGSSVNDGKDKDSFLNETFKLRLPGIDRLVEFVNMKGKGCHVFKKELQRAYRQIPVDPADYHMLGLSNNGRFYFHTTVPFGLRSATMACQRTTKGVYIWNQEEILVDVYIEDSSANS